MKKTFKYLLFIILLPVNLFLILTIILLSKFMSVKIYRLEADRIGHLFFNTFLFYVRNKKKIYNEKSKFNLVIPFFDKNIHLSNNYLLQYWKKFFKFDTTGLINYLYLTDTYLFKNKIPFIKIRPYDYDNTLLDADLLIKFNQEEIINGNNFLRSLGIKENDKYVCLLLRDNKYLKETFPNKDYSYHDYRNVKITNYLEACNFLTSKGIKVIRMGKNVYDKFETNNKMIIDYANHQERNDFMDIYLSANCYFWITVGSGIDASSYVFQKPVLNTNRTPVGFLMANRFSLSIIKHYFDIKNNKRLSFDEIYKRSLNLNLTANMLKNNEIVLIENTSEEILNATKEFYDCLQGKFDYENERNILNNQIKNTIKYDEKDFLDINDKPIKNFKNYPNFSYSFLIKNKYLLK